MGKDIAVLRTVLKGYSKADVLARLDEINSVILVYEQGGMTKAEALAAIDSAAEKPIKTAFSGFDKEQVTEYIAELRRRTENG
ncbi:MAG: hypothetical protein IJ874_05570 [Ruminococcus sp.]|nr:hypothetical protein [Ruminococcus sp.]